MALTQEQVNQYALAEAQDTGFGMKDYNFLTELGALNNQLVEIAMNAPIIGDVAKQKMIANFDVSDGFGQRKNDQLLKLGATREQIIDIASNAPVIGDKMIEEYPELEKVDYNIRHANLKSQLKKMYDTLIENEPKAAYGGRQSDIDKIFFNQAKKLADKGVGDLAELTERVDDNGNRFVINRNTGEQLFKINKDRDTGVNKWGDVFSGIKDGANFGIEFDPEGRAVLFPVHEKTKGLAQQLVGRDLAKLVTPIATVAGAVYGGPAGAAAGSAVGQYATTGEIDPAQVALAAGTAYLGSKVGGGADLSGTTGGMTGADLGFDVATGGSAASSAASSIPSGLQSIGEGALLGAGIGIATGSDPIKLAIAGAVGSVGSTTYATSVGESLGATGAAAPIVGNAVINSALSGIAAAATGANIEKSMLDGAIKGAAVAGSTEFAEAILGKDNIASIAKAAGLEDKQIANIFTTSVANGVTAEISGQGEFLETVGISLAAQGVGAKSADLMKGAMKDVLDKDPEIMAGVLTATGGIATTAANAALRGEDVGKALENSAPGIILSSVQAYQAEADRQDEIKRKQEEAAAAQRQKELGAVQQPPAPGDAVEGGAPIEGEGVGEVSLGEPPLQVAGDELGLGTTLDILEAMKREALTGIGEEVIDTAIVEEDGITYDVKLVQGVKDDGSLYEYKIIVDPNGSVSYEWSPSFTETVASRNRPDLRTASSETAVPSDRINLFGTSKDDLRPIAVPDEPPIEIGIDLRRYGDPSLGGGQALIRAADGAAGFGFTQTPNIFQFIGTEPTTGLQKYKVGDQSFTLIMLPNKQPALLNDIVDIVLIPREEPSPDPTQPPQLTFEERPLEDFTPPPEDVKPPEPTKLPPGTAADRDEGASGEAGEKGAAGGLTGLEEQRRKEREATISRIIEEELSRLTQQLTQAENEAQQAAKNLQRAQEQQRKFTAPQFISIAGPDLATSLEQETQRAAAEAERAEAARAAAAAERGDFGALQRGEKTLSDQQILAYLRTGQLPPAGGEGDGEPGTRGPGTGADEKGPGTGALDRGEGPGAGDRGTGPGAGEEGLGPGGGGTGGEGSGELTTPLRPSLIFDRETGGRPETTPFASRVTGEALASILGEKEPLFGGDEDEQRAVWNRRSLRLLSRALGL